jgi:hypothetical protein
MPDEAPRLDARASALRRPELEALAARLRLVFDAVHRERLEDATAPLGAATYVRLEELASRLHEVDRGAREGAPVREPDGRLTPSRSRAVPVAAAPPGVDPARLLERLRAQERSARHRLSEAGAYALVSRNCVTELVRTAIDVLGGPEEAERALGGRIHPGEGAGFIPFVFFAQVRERLSPRTTRLAPWRERALAAARTRADDPRWVDLRESNTLTSRLYTLRDRDSRFLLFTDGIFWRRPLYGAVNTVWALADVVGGLVTAPADRGRRLLRGGYGVIYSLPELAFFNVRKGSFDAATLPGDGLLEAVEAVAAVEPR